MIVRRLPLKYFINLHPLKYLLLPAIYSPIKRVTSSIILRKGPFTTVSAFLLYKYFQKDTAMAKNLSLTDVISQADALYDDLKFEELYNLLFSYKDEKSADILWRLARATYEKARKTNDTGKQREYYKEALDLLNESLSLDNDIFASHKWMAIIMDCYYTLEGTKARLTHLYEMRTHMEKACELKPKDGTSWFILGMWYFGIANLSWYERKGAAFFFATPPEATYEEALETFLKAEEAEPNFYSKNFLMIGKCFYYLSKKEEAKEYLTKARDYPQKTLDDDEAKKEAESFLKSL